MEAPAQFTFTLDGSTRMFPIPIIVKGDNYIQLDVDGVVITDRGAYDIVNNKVVFEDTSLLPNGSLLRALVAQSDETLGQIGDNITAVETVAQNIANINAVAGDLATIIQIAPDLGNASAIAQLQTDVGVNTAQLYANGLTLGSHGTAIAGLESQVLTLVTDLSVYGVLDMQNVVAGSGAIPSPITGYNTGTSGNYMTHSAGNGEITPTNTGYYRVSAFVTIDITPTNSTRSFDLTFFDRTAGLAKGAAVVNIPRDASYASASFTMLTALTGGNDYGLEMSSSTDLTFTVESLNFSIEKV